MPKLFCFFLLAVFIVGAMPTVVYADAYGAPPPMTNRPLQAGAPRQGSYDYERTLLTKLGSGLSNISLAIFELPKNVIITTNETNLALGITGGLVKGCLQMIGRTAVGLTDFLTFPIPTAPIINPQFPWEQYDVETHYNSVFKMQK